jgi:CBS domain containing-hemolysin-like protein
VGDHLTIEGIEVQVEAVEHRSVKSVLVVPAVSPDSQDER